MRRTWSLAGVLAVALALRFAWITWGFGDGYVFPDEAYFAGHMARFVPLSWASFVPDQLLYPTLYSDIGGFVVAALYSLGAIVQPRPFAPSTILVGRVIAASASFAAVVATYCLAERLYDRRTGLVAALLLALVPAHAFSGQQASTDSLLTLGFCLSALAA